MIIIEPDGYANTTVIIPSIPGREEMRNRAVMSVQSQTIPAVTIINVDSEQSGAANTRNAALSHVDTTYLAWLDDDDELLPPHLELLTTAMQETGSDLAYSCMEVVGGRDPLATTQGGRMVNPCGVPFGPEQESHLRQLGGFIPVTYAMRTDIAKKVGGMPNIFTLEWPRDCEDYGFLIRLLDAGAKFTHVPEVTWKYHIHGENTGGGWTGFK